MLTEIGRPSTLLSILEYTYDSAWLVEAAIRRIDKAKVLGPIQAKLEKALQEAFREQGRRFMKEFAKLEPWFLK